jgi:hypothetical protein
MAAIDYVATITVDDTKNPGQQISVDPDTISTAPDLHIASSWFATSATMNTESPSLGNISVAEGERVSENGSSVDQREERLLMPAIVHKK